MTAYLLSLLGASLTIALVNLLSPDSAAGHVRFISSLVLVCILIAPLPSAFEGLDELMGGLDHATDEKLPTKEDYATELEHAMNGASKVYLAQTLTNLLTEHFSIPENELRCVIRWEEGDEPHPARVTVILSGSAKWKNPTEIENFVSDLLGCECVSAIE